MKHIVGPWVNSVFDVYYLFLLASVQILLFTLKYFSQSKIYPCTGHMAYIVYMVSVRSMHFRTFYKVLKS